MLMAYYSNERRTFYDFYNSIKIDFFLRIDFVPSDPSKNQSLSQNERKLLAVDSEKNENVYIFFHGHLYHD